MSPSSLPNFHDNKNSTRYFLDTNRILALLPKNTVASQCLQREVQTLFLSFKTCPAIVWLQSAFPGLSSTSLLFIFYMPCILDNVLTILYMQFLPFCMDSLCLMFFSPFRIQLKCPLLHEVLNSPGQRQSFRLVNIYSTISVHICRHLSPSTLSYSSIHLLFIPPY